ncbi:polynucleotide adenylyltransferase PcnB [Mesosutterella sp. OilRF-GAM-744-9]|uniref:Poly(A) polymerase I n=1 Tax=Mesosutterella porci TaxID=2915351 RepID=A0ABS9MRT9_9BURK|nr:polynucleotide adenylyltransferase PcnB [Mesosutterella sp. oilRF-744-WT-GAM-9]MCG5031319.1 polynucleotide adenylyltransferase PcnB [Mesosutterella sp. oilRF-744-WT-GAM-9]
MAVFQTFVRKVRNMLGVTAGTQVQKTPRIIPASVHGIDPKLVAWQAIRTCEALQRRGFKAYIVGGAVRDMLLGVTPKDFDVATDATPEQVKACERRAIIIGRRFKLVHVIFGREVIECATFRSLDTQGVRKDENGRVISDNIYGEMWEDAARRDFTINSLYYNPATQEILDYHNGYEDLRAKCLRIIGDPEVRYREDPVRMMRAVRIASKLGFRIDEETRRPIPKMAPLLKNVPDARLFDEIIKLLTSGHALACIREFKREGLHHGLLPVLDLMDTASEGEKFLMLALQRTDERINAGKKTSPAFLFATLLWPQMLKRWNSFIAKGESRPQALYDASGLVLDSQCQNLTIQRRYIADIRLIWMLQYRFERRYGKAPFGLVEHPKYRAAYDFMMLRAQIGQVPVEVVQWWKNFYEADEQERHALVAAAEKEARRAGSAKRRAAPLQPSEAASLALNPQPGQGPIPRPQGEDSEDAGEGRRRFRGPRRRRSRAKAPEAPTTFFVPPESDRKLTRQQRPYRPAKADPDVREG